MAGLDTNTKLLLHFDGADASTTLTDITGRHTVTRDGNGQIDTAQSVFGGASFLMDGTGDGFNSADSADWDLWGDNTESWTIDVRVRLENVGKAQTILAQYGGAGAHWIFYIDNNNRIALNKDAGNVMQTAALIAADNWYHIALIKVANEWGIYLNGTQVEYLDDNSEATYTASLYGGIRDVSGQDPTDGWFDELRIQKSNYFNAAPAGDNSDTITVPTAAYSWVPPKGGVGIGAPLVF